jgi:hypothetical protein
MAKGMPLLLPDGMCAQQFTIEREAQCGSARPEPHDGEASAPHIGHGRSMKLVN